MSKLRDLIHEIHRRSLWQVLGIYAVSGWVVYQVVLGLYEGIGLPDWVPATAVVLLLVGLPIVLATAFVQEGGPGLRGEGGDKGGEDAGGEASASASRAERRAAPASSGSGTGGRRAGLFTWSRAITAGVLAFAALGLAATGFMGMRALGVGPAATLMARGVIDAGDPIVLADFDNGTEEERLGEMVTEALRVDLLGSPVLELVEPGAIRRGLDRMRREGVERLGGELALELAVRDGYRAVIRGEVGPVGAGYLLTAEVVAPEGGTLVAFRETASDAAGLLPAIDRLSSAIRGKIGESLKSARSGEPLAQVTTESLEALRKYSQAERLAEREADYLRAIGLLEEAVALDPGFAMAHRKIAVYWSNIGVNLDRQVEALSRAYEHRDRLNARERAQAVAMYYGKVTGDYDAAIQAYRNLLADYPNDPVATNNLAALHNDRGEFSAAESTLAGARRAGALTPTNYVNLAHALWGQGRVEEVDSIVAGFHRRYPENPSAGVLAAWVAEWAGDLSAADSAFRAVVRRFGSNLLIRARTELGLARLEAQRGRLEEARATMARVAEAAHRLGAASAAALVTAEGALIAARIAGPDAFDRQYAELRAATPLDSLPPLDRPYHHLAEAQLWTGRPDEAEALLDAFEDAVPAERRGALEPHHRLLRHWAAVLKGEHERLSEIRSALDRHPCRRCVVDVVAYAHEIAGEEGRALDLYEEHMESRMLQQHLVVNARARAFVLQRLAELYDRRGDDARAARYYTAFIDLWRDADPELQPRVEAARRALTRLATEASG